MTFTDFTVSGNTNNGIEIGGVFYIGEVHEDDSTFTLNVDTLD